MKEKIIMYSTTHCSDCFRAKKFFDANGVAYETIYIEGNAEATEFVLKTNNGYQSVPTIVFPDGSTLTEPSNAELAEKLGL